MSKLTVIKGPSFFGNHVVIAGGITRSERGVFLDPVTLSLLASQNDPIAFIKELPTVKADEGVDEVEEGSLMGYIEGDVDTFYVQVQGDSIVFTSGYNPAHVFTIKTGVEDFVSLLADFKTQFDVEEESEAPVKAPVKSAKATKAAKEQPK